MEILFYWIPGQARDDIHYLVLPHPILLSFRPSCLRRVEESCLNDLTLEIRGKIPRLRCAPLGMTPFFTVIASEFCERGDLGYITRPGLPRRLSPPQNDNKNLVILNAVKDLSLIKQQDPSTSLRSAQDDSEKGGSE